MWSDSSFASLQPVPTSQLYIGRIMIFSAETCQCGAHSHSLLTRLRTTYDKRNTSVPQAHEFPKASQGHNCICHIITIQRIQHRILCTGDNISQRYTRRTTCIPLLPMRSALQLASMGSNLQFPSNGSSNCRPPTLMCHFTEDFIGNVR